MLWLITKLPHHWMLLALKTTMRLSLLTARSLSLDLSFFASVSFGQHICVLSREREREGERKGNKRGRRRKAEEEQSSIDAFCSLCRRQRRIHCFYSIPPSSSILTGRYLAETITRQKIDGRKYTYLIKHIKISLYGMCM